MVSLQMNPVRNLAAADLPPTPAIVAAKLLLLSPLLPDPLKRLCLALGLILRLILRLGLHCLRMVLHQLRVLLLQLLVRQRVAGVVEGVPLDRPQIVLQLVHPLL